MSDDKDNEARNESLFDVLERIRAENYPHIDREIVREILRLHAEPTSNDLELSRAIDEMIFARTGN